MILLFMLRFVTLFSSATDVNLRAVKISSEVLQRA